MKTILLLYLILAYVKNWIVSVSFLLAIRPYILTHLGKWEPVIFKHPHLGFDNLRVILVLLTRWITGMVLITESHLWHRNMKGSLFHVICLSQGFTLTFTFLSAYWLVTYLSFEGSLIPTLLIILIWGKNPERLKAGIYFLIYTVAASLPLIVTLLGFLIGNIKPRQWFDHGVIIDPGIYVSIFLLLAFLVKLPIFLFHIWLPKAHVEAPVGGRIFLAGVLLKLGPYGVIRIFELYPFLESEWSHIVVPWSLWGSIIRALICLRQVDIKSLVAYASVRHIGLTIARIFSGSYLGTVGAKIMLIAHGLVRASLFALVNFYYERTQSRSLLVNRGIIHAAPALAFWWCMAVAANAAIPPSFNFLAEVFIYMGLISCSSGVGVPLILISYSILTLLYSMIMYTVIHHGGISCHINYITSRGIYYTISFLLLCPAYVTTLGGRFFFY